MSHDDERNELRIGGWLPPYQGEVGSGSDRLPVPVSYYRLPAPADDPSRRARRVLLACGLVVVAGVTGMMALLLPTEAQAPPPTAERMIFPTQPEPSAAVSLLPTAPGTSSAPTATTRSTEVSAVVPTTRRPAPPAASRTISPAAPVPALNVGSTIGLEVKALPGWRVRHRDFRGRVDRITSSSSALDRADSRFVVRKGLARDRCVSLESVNYPGYFLRHRDFVIHLDRRGRSQLFEQDATFCPEPTGDGSAVILESINYPSMAVALRRDGSLRLDDDGKIAFVVRAPL